MANESASVDVTAALAGIIAAALAADSIDRIELDCAIARVLHGEARLAERLGIAVAMAAQAALHQTPRTPAQKAAEAFVK